MATRKVAMKHFMYLRLDYDATPGHGPSTHGKVRVLSEGWYSDGDWIEVKNPIKSAGVYHRKFFKEV